MGMCSRSGGAKLFKKPLKLQLDNTTGTMGRILISIGVEQFCFNSYAVYRGEPQGASCHLLTRDLNF